MGATPEDPYRLQEKAEQWQTLASRQQDLAMRLRQLASDQRDLSEFWLAADAEEFLVEVRALEDGLRALSTQALGLERVALDRVAHVIAAETRVIAEEARALRPE